MTTTTIQHSVVKVEPDKFFLDNGYEVENESNGHYLYTKTVEYNGDVFVIDATDINNTEPSYRYTPDDDVYGCWNFGLNNDDPYTYGEAELNWTKYGEKFSLAGPEDALSLEEVELFFINSHINNKRREEEEQRLKLLGK